MENVLEISSDEENSVQNEVNLAQNEVNLVQNEVNLAQNEENLVQNEENVGRNVEIPETVREVYLESDDDSEIAPVRVMQPVNNFDYEMAIDSDDDCTRSTILYSVEADNIAQNYGEIYLSQFEPEIDDFLANTPNDVLTENMIRYANHDWQYSAQSSLMKKRLTHLRMLVEAQIAKEREMRKKVVWDEADSMDREATSKVPVCSVCFYDIRNEFFLLRRIYVTICGHLFHKHCLKRVVEKYSTAKCPTCNRRISMQSCRRVFFQFK